MPSPSKEELMKALLDRYQQLDSLDHSPAAKKLLELYIRKLELTLKDLL